ncbi:MAG: ABC transporter related protein, partial [Candidatus Peregrinibacteria bacterium GW2011_GWA2_44_7]
MENHYFFLIKTAWAFARHHRTTMVVVYVMFVIANLIAMSEPLVLGLFLNKLQEGGDDLLHMSILYLGFYASLEFFFWIFHGNARVMERQIGFDIVRNFKEQLFKEVASLPLKWHKDHHSGGVVSRIEKATKALNGFTQDSYIFIETIVRFIVCIVAFFLILPASGFMALGMGILIVITIFKFDRILISTLKAVNEKIHLSDSTFYDYMSNIMTVITLRLENLARSELVNKINAIFPIWRKNIRVNEVKWFSISMGLALTNFAILIFYIYSETKGGGVIMIGSFIALYQYTSRFIEVFFGLAWKYEQLVWYSTDLKSVNPIRKTFEKMEKKDQTKPPTDWDTITIKNLYFRYEDEKNEKHNLDNINLELKRSLKIAFIGESGSGKSTLMTLLRGLENPNKVKVLIDGKRFETLKSISNWVTLIPQEAEIFENTIEYNVTAGVAHKKTEVVKACELACFNKVLKRLPKGIKTNIKEKGVNLSGGEKQRLALARGLFAGQNSSILILDEPTSSMDTKNELEIYDIMLAPSSFVAFELDSKLIFVSKKEKN